MKKYFISVTFLMYGSLNCFSQKVISARESKEHIGELITVCDKVFSARYLEASNNAPTLVNLGGAYPNNPFTLVIFGDTRIKFTYKPEQYLVSKLVCVTGKITEYKGKPEIIVTDTTQLIVK